ncbi:hypothetical protein DF182_01330 [Chitinophaga flava]|uniref:VCBS repeat-containing protein n=2 Tax=Chitinophaga flava TaxID=2259036 RepID=A0A365Y038_9BACT|nr:hypothetical protein DF182_01330 [Chitinophaga flava]
MILAAACGGGNKKKNQENKMQHAMPEKKITFSMDTTFHEYHFSIFTRGDATMRNLYVGIGSVKDTTRADTVVEKDIKGTIANVTVADLDNDGKPEVYVFTTSSGTDQYGKVYGLAILGRRAVEINTDAIDSLAEKDYRGRDSFYVSGKELVRTFPAFRGDEEVELKSDSIRMVRYKLIKSGNTYVLKE